MSHKTKKTVQNTELYLELYESDRLFSAFMNVYHLLLTQNYVFLCDLAFHMKFCVYD